MMTTQLDRTLESYEAAIEDLNVSKIECSKIEIEQVLSILHARDVLQVALKEEKNIPSSTLRRLILLDAQLREQAGIIRAC